MFNRSEYGLHHPGNTVPCCPSCNKRERLEDKSYCHWEEHLKKVCIRQSEEHLFKSRHLKLLNHFKKYEYPVLNDNEQHSIRVIANSLYENIKAESEKSLTMYKELDKAFVK